MSLQLALIDIIAHSLSASYILGWTSYFGLYLIACAIIIINSFSFRLYLKITEVSVVSILFIVLYVLTNDGYRVIAINTMILDGIGLFNVVSVTFAVLLMSFRNFIENALLARRLEEMSDLDTLTGAYNRRFFNKYLDIEIKRNVSQIKYNIESAVNFGIAMVDIDDFKRINDKYGHLTGDNVLIDFVAVIKSSLFERDVLCRYGGEEFVILLAATSREGAIFAIEKIRTKVESHFFSLDKDTPEKSANLTISIGFASFNEESDIQKLLALADKRCLDAKNAGKNRVVYE